jgi:hypothetical protein
MNNVIYMFRTELCYLYIMIDGKILMINISDETGNEFMTIPKFINTSPKSFKQFIEHGIFDFLGLRNSEFNYNILSEFDTKGTAFEVNEEEKVYNHVSHVVISVKDSSAKKYNTLVEKDQNFDLIPIETICISPLSGLCDPRIEMYVRSALYIESTTPGTFL